MNGDFKVQPFYVYGLEVTLVMATLVMAFSVLYDGLAVFVEAKYVFG